MGRIVDGRFEITNEILKMSLFGGRLCNGYVNHDEFSRSRALLTYLTQEIFSIHRFPGFDEFYRSNHEFKIRQAFIELDPQVIQAAKAELQELYEYTQSYLRQTFPSKTSLRISRSLNIEEQKQVTNQLIDNKEIVEFESNIILSFADHNWLGSYTSNVFLTLDVPFEQILIHYDSLSFPKAITGEEKENEIWVINTNPFGRITQPRENFQSKNLSRRRDDYPIWITPMSEDFWGYEKALEKHQKVWEDPWVVTARLN